MYLIILILAVTSISFGQCGPNGVPILLPSLNNGLSTWVCSTFNPSGNALPTWHKYTVTAVANASDCLNSAVSPVVFTGGGLNDATSGGTYTATTAQATYTVIIDTAAVPDKFKWKKNSGSFTTGVTITGAAQTLSDGVTITFAATTGHTLTDQWVITAGLGCWAVTDAITGTVVNTVKAAGLTQSLTLFTLPANGVVSQYRLKTATACTGTTTLTTGLGTSSTPALFLLAAGYNLKTAVSATNVSTALPLVTNSDTAASVAAVNSLVSTVSNLNAVADGCSWDAHILWGVLP